MELPDDEIDIPPGYMHVIRRGKVNRFIFLWRNGRKDHFPICCVFRFALDMALADGKTLSQERASGRKRGSIQRGDTVFVPCNIFHHAGRET